MKNSLMVLIAVAVFFTVNVSVLRADHRKSDSEVLTEVCKMYSDNWAGLKYHYKNKEQFNRLCSKRTDGKNLLEGMWGIRSSIPDGHADFRIHNKGKSQLYELVFIYNPLKNVLRVGAVFDKKLKSYLGRGVSSINDVDALSVLRRRAVLEPQSTLAGGLEVAARTLTYSFREMPYPDFPDKLVIKFRNGEVLSLKPVEVNKKYIDKHPFVISNNNWPSIWGNFELLEDKELCKSENEISKVIEHNSEKWLFWHPLSLGFDAGDLSNFECWKENINNVSGVILDLRDTAGGDFKQVAGLVYLLNIRDVLNVVRVEDDLTVEAPNKMKSLQKWSGKVLMLTNGLCGSGCEILANEVSKRVNTCSYGTPTAGRLIGTDEVNVFNRVSVGIPSREILSSDGARWEGRALNPKHFGIGDIRQALRECNF